MRGMDTQKVNLGTGTKFSRIAQIIPGESWKDPLVTTALELPWWLRHKESTCQCRRHRFDPRVGKILWRRRGNPLQYSCQGNPIDREAWRAAVHSIAKKVDMTTTIALEQEQTGAFFHLFHSLI